MHPDRNALRAFTNLEDGGENRHARETIPEITAVYAGGSA